MAIITENEDLQQFFDSKGISNAFSYSTEYGDVFIVDKKDIQEEGILKLTGEERVEQEIDGKKKKFNLYKFIRVNKKKVISFEDYYTNDFLKMLDSDGKTGFSCGIDLETGKKHLSYLNQYTNLGFAGSQGSGKSVMLFSIFYQLYQKKFSEFIIFDKGDLQPLCILPKVIAGANVLNDGKENLYQLYNYLFLQARKRRMMFEKAKVTGYYDYMKKHFKGDENAAEPLNHIFVFLDEFNTWRKERETDIGLQKFDTLIGNIINVLRFAGVSIFPASQTLMASDIGVLSRGGIKARYAGVVTRVDTIKEEDKLQNLKAYLAGTYCFYAINEDKFFKPPLISGSDMLIEKLETYELDPNYKNLKSEGLTKLVNSYVTSVKKDSLIMQEYEENFKFFGFTSEQIKELEEDFLFIAFSVLVYKIRNMFEKGVLDKSYNFFQAFKFKTEAGGESLDNTLQENIEVLLGKEESKFVKEIENSFEIVEEDPDAFIDRLGEILRTSLIRRGIIGNGNSPVRRLRGEKTAVEGKTMPVNNSDKKFKDKDEILSQVLEDKEEAEDLTIEEDEEEEKEHHGMRDIAEMLRNS